MKNRQPENTILYIIVPCYNEELLISDSSAKLTAKLDQLVGDHLISAESRILFVDDGSTDDSWEIIRSLCETDIRICGVALAHNRGHQTALIAGLMTAKDMADVTITVDADLQQDIGAMDQFLEEYYKGSDIVYGIRKNRDADSMPKKHSAEAYYSLMNAFGIGIRKNAADYRLLSKTAMEALSEYKEINLFLRGVVTDIGLESSEVYFDVFPREKGTSKYTAGKMSSLALNGITSYSTVPIHIIFIMGAVCLLLSFAMIVYVLIDWIIGNTVPGYASILISLWLIGGLILFGLGIVGEYVGQTYFESKRRPRYYIKDKCLDLDSETANNKKTTTDERASFS